jgi:hypothetical protein
MPDWIFNTNDMTFRVCGEQKKIGQNANCDYTKLQALKQNANIGRCLLDTII